MNGVLSKNKKMLLKRKSDVLFVYIFALVLVIVSAFLDSNFLTPGNLGNIFTTWLPLILAAYAQTFVIIMGGIDLTLGMVVSLSNVICAAMMAQFGWLLPVVISIAAGAVVGLCNGLIITKAKQQPMIVTLSMSTIISGLALIVLGRPGGKADEGFAKAIIYGLDKNMPVLLLIVLTIVIWFILNRTRFGRYIFAIGGNENSAISTGINVDRIKIAAYIFSGVISAISGIYLTALMRSGDPLIGTQYTMRAITAVVVGGTAFTGGKGGITGVLAGVLILAVVNNMLNFLGVSSYYQYVLQGAILILALAVSALRTRR